MRGAERESGVGQRRGERSRNPAYLPPKDALEEDRLNLQHRVFQIALQGNFAAPLDAGVSRILDVGSGSGIWGDEMARDFPASRVVNVDIDPAVLTAPLRSQNCNFVQGSIFQGLPFPNGLFDFTHQRMLATAVPVSAWSGVVRELIRVTRPGGWVELLEMGNPSSNAGSATTSLMGWVADMIGARGMDLGFMEQLGRVADEAALKVRQVRHLDLPLGSWDQPIGILLERTHLMIFETLQPLVCQALNVPPADYASALRAAPDEWAGNRATWRFHLVVGQA